MQICILCNAEISPVFKILRESDTIPPIPTTPGQINVELRFVVQSIFLRSICSPFVMQSVFAQTTFVFVCMPCFLEGAWRIQVVSTRFVVQSFFLAIGFCFASNHLFRNRSFLMCWHASRNRLCTCCFAIVIFGHYSLANDCSRKRYVSQALLLVIVGIV